MYMDDMSGYDRANCPMNMDQTPMMGPMMGPMAGPMMGPMMGNPMMNSSMMNPMMNEPMMQMGMRPLETLYPDIYKLVFPMVVRACDNLKFMGMTNNMITINMIDDMVINIYDSVNMDEDRSEGGEDAQRADDDLRQRERFDLRDLIRILLIRELFRRGHTHFRPFGENMRIYGKYGRLW